MSLYAKDLKDSRGAYKAAQKLLYRKDFRKGKNQCPTRPWKKSKGYGTRSGRESYPGRNYGCRWEQSRWFISLDKNLIRENGHDYDGDVDCGYGQGNELEDSDGCDSAGVSTEADLIELEPYEIQLAQALSLSLAEAIEHDENESLDDTDGYSFMETDSDSDSEGTDVSDETESEWVGVAELNRPTYAQMAKVEVT